MKLLPIAARNVFRNSRRTILSALATAVATLAIVFLFAYIAGIQKDYSSVLSTFVSGHLRVRHQEFDELEHLNPLHLRITEYGPLVQYLEGLEEVRRVSPRLTLPATVYQENQDDQTRIQAQGIEFSREAQGMNLDELLVLGTLPLPGDRGAVMGPQLAKDLGLEVGDQFNLLAQSMRRDLNVVGFTLRGIITFPVASMNKSTILLPLEEAQRLGRMKNAISEILITLKDETKAQELAPLYSEKIQDQGFSTSETPLSVKNWKEIDVIFGFLGMAQMIYSFVGAMFFVLASTVLINTTMMVINERTREIGTLGAMGLQGKEIIRLFFLEALIIAILGATSGAILGSILSLVIGHVGIDLSAAMDGMDFNIPGILYPQFHLGTTVLIWLYAIVVTGLTALIPSRRAAKILPVEALRYEG